MKQIITWHKLFLYRRLFLSAFLSLCLFCVKFCGYIAPNMNRFLTMFYLLENNTKGEILRFLYFADCFFCLWKLMLPHLKLLWQVLLKTLQINSFFKNWWYHHIKNFIALYTFERKTFCIIFKVRSKTCYLLITFPH